MSAVGKTSSTAPAGVEGSHVADTTHGLAPVARATNRVALEQPAHGPLRSLKDAAWVVLGVLFGTAICFVAVYPFVLLATGHAASFASLAVFAMLTGSLWERRRDRIVSGRHTSPIGARLHGRSLPVARTA